MLRLTSFLAAIFIISLLASCGSLKELQYLQGNIDTSAYRDINYIEPVIQKGDLISITVYSDNQLASAVYNQGGTSTTTVASPGTTTQQGASNVAGAGYLVNQDGVIQLYAIGTLKVEGFTKKQLGDYLVKQYVDKNLLKNPFVEVRFQNFKITVIGDVTAPGAKTFATEKVSIFDALAQAGDLTAYAKRSNVLVVREANGIRQFARLDLTNPTVFSSPYYFLQQNDMVVVDPTKLKATLTDQTLRNITIATSIISIGALIYSIITR